NNMLGEEDLNPGGFHTWPAGRRLSSMMAPTVLRHEDGRLLALGSGGSNRLRTAITQVLVSFLDLGLSLEEAVVRPRLHFEHGKLQIEPGFPPESIRFLEATYPDHRFWPRPNLYFGGVHAAGVDLRDGSFFGASDARRGGVTRYVGQQPRRAPLTPGLDLDRSCRSR
ncbi:MAG: gamma-glutamyltransferase, partial [Acidobacteria bacterium]|nr:gamma-glutamyltransferase [Acidobacteriota bacterium]